MAVLSPSPTAGRSRPARRAIRSSTPRSITDAYGIFAQSVGGTGGNGGLAGALSAQPQGSGAPVNVTIAVGGNGGSSGTGGKVTVDNSGAITTINDASHAIFAQSVGGSGGAGGSGFAVSFELTSSEDAGVYNLAFGVGGRGGNASTGGEVDVTNNGATISTSGAVAHGIYAHSVGGSGGSGGSARTMAYTFNPEFRPPGGRTASTFRSASVAMAAPAATAGPCTVGNSGTIQTQGDGSYGIFAYSVGGGGGDGGSAAGLLTIPFTDRVKFYKNVAIEVGGKAGSSGAGGDVTVTHTAGNILTAGSTAPGIVAQSVGGGGGTGGTGAAGATGTVAIGGRGGAAGDGGDVTVKFSGGNISTQGGGTGSSDPGTDIDSSYGIFAQSVGGGGGVAGNATFFGIPTSTSGGALGGVTIGIGLGIDLQGGNGGDGGTVSVDTTGNIGTEGPNAIGIFAQSVGGGGGVSGNLGFSPASEQALIGSVGGNGAGGAVDVTYTGSLTTAGGGAHGVFAQSAGGSGSGTVTVDVTGSVAASGSEAAGIFAQSVKLDSLATGTVGGDKINITLADGSQVQGGTPGVNNEAPGVLILDGTDNLLMTGASMLSNAKALAGDMSGYAIIATTGNDAVVNNGVILGSVDLGTGANTMNNDGSGILYSGTQLNVGAGNTFTNFGRLSPGGDEVLQTTALTGNLVQATGGNYLVTLDGAQVNVNDRVDVSGTADMAGTVQVQVIDAGTSTAPNQTTIIQSTGGVSAATVQNLTVQPSAVGNFGLVFSNPQKVDLTYAIDFSTPELAAGLNDNQEAAADYLEALHAAGRIEPRAALPVGRRGHQCLRRGARPAEPRALRGELLGGGAGGPAVQRRAAELPRARRRRALHPRGPVLPHRPAGPALRARPLEQRHRLRHRCRRDLARGAAGAERALAARRRRGVRVLAGRGRRRHLAQLGRPVPGWRGHQASDPLDRAVGSAERRLRQCRRPPRRHADRHRQRRPGRRVRWRPAARGARDRVRRLVPQAAQRSERRLGPHRRGRRIRCGRRQSRRRG